MENLLRFPALRENPILRIVPIKGEMIAAPTRILEEFCVNPIEQIRVALIIVSSLHADVFPSKVIRVSISLYGAPSIVKLVMFFFEFI